MEYDTVQMKVTQMQIKLTKMCKIISSYENYTMLHVILLIFFIPRNKEQNTHLQLFNESVFRTQYR